MMLQGFAQGELVLEERAAQSRRRRIRGRFPYNTLATISNGGRTGRPKKEQFASRAFRWSVEESDREIWMLVGHDMDRPLASRGAGTLALRDSDDALTFEAMLTEEMQEVTWVRDFLASYSSGLIVGLSPRFSIPPESASPNAEEIVEEDPAEGRALIRTINDAILHELSAVTVPAYPQAEIEARSWELSDKCADLRTLKRWLL